MQSFSHHAGFLTWRLFDRRSKDGQPSESQSAQVLHKVCDHTFVGLCYSKSQLCADRSQTSCRRRILLRRYKASDSSFYRCPDRCRGLEAQPCLAPAATATTGRFRKESPEAPSGRIRHPRFCDPTSPSTRFHALLYLTPERKCTSMPQSPFEILETFLCAAPVKNCSALAAAFAFMALKTTHQ